MINLFLICNLSFSQSLSVGIKDGINQTGIKYQLDNPSYHFKKIKWGRNTGLILNYRMTDFLSLQTEIYREERGFDFNNINPKIDGNESIYGSYKMNYLIIPLLANFEIGKSFKLYGYGGFYKGFNLSSHNQIISSVVLPSVGTEDRSYNPENEFRNSEIGAITGLGIKIPLDKKVIFYIDTRYEAGLTKAVTGDNVKYTDYHLYNEHYYYHVIVTKIHDTYNRAFSINWGVLYRIYWK
jgi:hypothetical protein